VLLTKMYRLKGTGERKRKGETKVSVSWHGSMVNHSKSQGGKGAVIIEETAENLHRESEEVSMVFCARTLLYMSPLEKFIYMSGIWDEVLYC